MTLSEWMTILAPLLSGLSGILFALTIFIKWLRRLIKVVKDGILDNEKIGEELSNTRKSLTNIENKLNFLVEGQKNDKK